MFTFWQHISPYFAVDLIHTDVVVNHFYCGFTIHNITEKCIKSYHFVELTVCCTVQGHS